MLKMTTLRGLLLPVSLFALVGCQVGTDPELEISEGAAYLSVNEDDGEDIAGGGIVDDGNATIIDDLAEEQTEALPDPTTEPDAGVCTFEGLRARVVEGYDTDGDGRLSRAERLVLRADIDERRSRHPRLARLVKARRHVRFHMIRWAFDENNDRVLDETERQSLVDALEARCLARRVARLAEYDANGNGTLDADERDALRADRRARIEARRAEILAEFDADEDGTLNPEERQAWKADVRARFVARKAELKDHFDVDDDGRLNEAERAAAKAAVRERVASGDPLPRP